MRTGWRLAAWGCGALLTSCGGGGGDPGGPPAATFPSAGIYGWLLKPSGGTANLTFGLSLVHPGSRGDEYEIEPVTTSITATAVASSGTVDAALGRVDNIASHALLYIAAGDVRWLPLTANGTAPAGRVVRASIANACAFLVQENDYANPDGSGYVVSTQGADGVCGTADDGAIDVRAGATGVTVGPQLAEPTLGYLRNPVTMAPTSRVTGNEVDSGPSSSIFAIGVNGNRAQRIVGNAGSSMVYEFGTPGATALWFFDLRSALSDGPVRGVSTAGGGWQLIGYDAANYYVYRNGGTTTASTWQLLGISRAAPTATQLAGGTGLVVATAMGSNVLYATLQEFGGNRLIRLAKTSGGAPTTLEFDAPTTLATVLTSKLGVHQLWRVSGLGTANPNFQIEMKDEGLGGFYATSGGVPLAVLEPSSVDFNNSENRTRFAFVTGYGARAFADAPMVVYDSATLAATTVGVLPGASDFGTDQVLASFVSGSSDFFAGSATRISGGVAQGGSAKVFSGMAGSAGSLIYTDAKK